MVPTELKPCPFCGGRAHKDELDDGGRVIQCSGCLASSAVYYDRAENLIRSWNDRKIPEGMSLVPREITNETGHKTEMMSEFSQSIPVICDVCGGDGENEYKEGGVCADCDGAGEYVLNVNISWTNIKAIHKRIVEIAEAAE